MEILAFGTMFLYFALKIIGFFVGWKMAQDYLRTIEDVHNKGQSDETKVRLF